jgi:hypothetical protein
MPVRLATVIHEGMRAVHIVRRTFDRHGFVAARFPFRTSAPRLEDAGGRSDGSDARAGSMDVHCYP